MQDEPSRIGFSFMIPKDFKSAEGMEINIKTLDDGSKFLYVESPFEMLHKKDRVELISLPFRGKMVLPVNADTTKPVESSVEEAEDCNYLKIFIAKSKSSGK
jgi:hypothetical protein